MKQLSITAAAEKNDAEVENGRENKTIIAPPNPFDPASLRIDPSNEQEAGVRKELIHIAVRKPTRQEFFRVHHTEDYRNVMAILELKEEREIYAVMPMVARQVPSEIRMVDLRFCISRQGVPFLWPVPLPSADGRENAWHRTARAAAENGVKFWTRLVPNMGAGYYDIFTATAPFTDPVWPAETFADLLQVGFGGGRLIDSIDHPVIQRLKGH